MTWFRSSWRNFYKVKTYECNFKLFVDSAGNATVVHARRHSGSGYSEQNA